MFLWLKEAIFYLLVGVVKRLERCFSTEVRAFRWYGDHLYGRVLERELNLTELEPRKRVLHIGTGALPYTACYLAQRGFTVDAIDHDPQTLDRAKQMIKAIGVADRVNIMEREGLQVDAAGYAAIWISLHVYPKEAILERLVRTARQDCWIVYREPRGWLKLFYHSVGQSLRRLARRHAVCVHGLGRKSIAICAGPNMHDRRSV